MDKSNVPTLHQEAHDIFCIIETIFPQAVFLPIVVEDEFCFRIGTDNYRMVMKEHELSFYYRERELPEFTILNALCTTAFVQRAYSFIQVRIEERQNRKPQMYLKYS